MLSPLTELCGILHPQVSFFPWGFAEGNLNKLNTLIQQYVQLEGESKELKEIQILIEKIWKRPFPYEHNEWIEIGKHEPRYAFAYC